MCGDDGTRGPRLGDQHLSAKERDYLLSHRLGRLATVRPDGRPHVVPVGFQFNADSTIDIGGPNLGSSQKYRNVKGDTRVALVVDDTVPEHDPVFRAGVGRGIEIEGWAEALSDEEPPAFASPDFFSREVIRVHPERVLSWHLDESVPGLHVLADRGGRL